MARSCTLLLTLLLALAQAPTCLADTITVSSSLLDENIFLSAQSAGAEGQTTSSTLIWDESFDRDFSVAQFDSSLGVLESIEISFAATVLWTSDTVYLAEFPDAQLSAAFTGNVSLSDPAVVAMATASCSGNATVTVVDNILGVQYSEYGTSILTGNALVSLAQHATFVGNGTVTLPMTLQFTTVATLQHGFFEFTPVPVVNVTTTVTYTFTPVPEPSGLGLVLAFGLLALWRRR